VFKWQALALAELGRTRDDPIYSFQLPTQRHKGRRGGDLELKLEPSGPYNKHIDAVVSAIEMLKTAVESDLGTVERADNDTMHVQ
jgi:hypothetical protein